MPDPIERVHLHVAPDADVRVSADPERVAQILSNLLSNAVKYGEPASPIDVAVNGGDGPDAKDVRVTVSNRGPGIPSHELDRVFGRFERSPSTRRGNPGLGLGLYIAKELVEAHGGRIWAESVPEVITQFTSPCRASRPGSPPWSAPERGGSSDRHTSRCRDRARRP